MKENDIQKPLFQDFSQVTTDEWETLILKDLKGADYNKKLIWQSVEGIKVKPYYRNEDLLQNSQLIENQQAVNDSRNPQKGNAWLICQDIEFESVDAAVRKAEWMISRGVESVGIRFQSHPSKENLTALLDNLPLESVRFNYANIHPGEFIDILNEILVQKGLDPNKISGSLGWDPISDLLLSGQVDPFNEKMDEIPAWINALKPYPNLSLIEVSGLPLRHAGCSLVQELGFVVAAVIEYIDQLSDRGQTVEEIARRMTINLAVGSNYFFELAKFRATRSLWRKVLSAAGVSQVLPVFINASTSIWNKTIFDPHVNLLRTTTEAMSAVLGGADSLCITPYNAIYQSPTEFSERLARNQQLLLREEAYLDKVIDPAGGSYYIESITEDLKHESWKVMQQVESAGGFKEAFLQGIIQDAIVTVAEQRDKGLASRKDVLLGTNQYPNSEERKGDDYVSEIAFPAIVDPSGSDAQPLIPYRGAEGFEKLRLATEGANRKPKVFLLPIGHLAMRKARATFAANFFGCAGYEIIDNLGFSNVPDGMSKAQASGADIVVLCSSDDEYAIFGLEAAALSGEAELVIAGNPAEHKEKLEQAGIRHFIHVKTNVLESLQGFNELLGIHSK